MVVMWISVRFSLTASIAGSIPSAHFRSPFFLVVAAERAEESIHCAQREARAGTHPVSFIHTLLLLKSRALELQLYSYLVSRVLIQSRSSACCLPAPFRSHLLPHIQAALHSSKGDTTASLLQPELAYTPYTLYSPLPLSPHLQHDPFACVSSVFSRSRSCGKGDQPDRFHPPKAQTKGETPSAESSRHHLWSTTSGAFGTFGMLPLMLAALHQAENTIKIKVSP